MKPSIKLHLGRWAIGLIAIMAVGLAACGGDEQSTTAPAAPTPTVANVISAQPVIKDVSNTPVPAAKAEPTAIPAAVISAKDIVRIVTEFGSPTVGFATGLCTANILDIVCEDMVQDSFLWIDNDTFEVVTLTGFESWEHKYSDLLSLGILPGVLRGELCGLTWDNVDLNDNRISIIKNLGRITGKGLVSRNPKTSRSRRSLALSTATVNLLH